MKDSKNYVIVALCLVLCIMAVGYAAFSAQLSVNGTAQIGSTWNVGIPDTNGINCVPTVADGGAANSVTASGTRNSATSATLTIGFTQPGDSAICTIKVKNTGSIKAIVNEMAITIDGVTVTDLSTQTGTIKFSIMNGSLTPAIPETSTPATKLPATTGENSLIIKAEYPASATVSPEPNIDTNGDDVNDVYGNTIGVNFSYVQDFS